MSRMADFYLRIALEAGLDVEDDGWIDRVAGAIDATARPDDAPVDVFDQAVDYLILAAVG